MTFKEGLRKVLLGECKYIGTYYAKGMMGNWYECGEFEFTATDREIKNMRNVAYIGFLKNYDELIGHYKWSKKYSCDFTRLT